MMTSDDKVGGWVKKGQNHDDVILEWSLMYHGHFSARNGSKSKSKMSAAKSLSISSRLLLCHLAFLWYFLSKSLYNVSN